MVSEKSGHPAIFSIDLQLLHEVTSPQGFAMLKKRGLPFKFPERHVATLDHSIPTRKNRLEIYDPEARNQVDTFRQNVKDFGIRFFDFDSGNQGIVHVIGPELGLTQPGMSIVCGDSHTSTNGAFGALAFGIGSSEVGYVMATGCILQNKPKTMKVEFQGKRKPGVFSKDMILALIAQIGIAGGNGHIAEFSGEAIRTLSMEERMTICNMSIEFGARAGLIAPDETTFEYMKGRPFAPNENEWQKSVERWRALCSDPNSSYDKEVSIDGDNLSPRITWGTNPEQGIGIDERIPFLKDLSESHRGNAKKALEYVKLKEGQSMEGVPIDYAFLGSCTNSRIEDLRIAAGLMKGKKIAESLTMLVVPGSEAVKKQAEKEGLKNIFENAGCEWRNPGCSMCLGMNDDKVPPGKRCISSSNRNFVGRQGTGSITHLASPAMVAASAIEGRITDPRPYVIARSHA